MRHGFVDEGVLVKRGKQVVKFFKFNGYAVPIKDLEGIRGVQLHTKYDGVLYAPRNLFFEKGIYNNFNGEEQQVLPVQHWETVEER